MQPTFQLSQAMIFWIAIFFFAAIVAIAIARRIFLPMLTKVLVLIGLILLAIATSAPIWNRSKPLRIAVMIDVSSSTRGASWYDNHWLATRVSQLIGANEYQLYNFSSRQTVEQAALQRSHGELPTDETTFAPPPADAILLFSDCQFAIPFSAPPTFIVVDPILEQPSDGAIKQLSSSGDDITIVVKNQLLGDANEKPRQLSITGVQNSAELPIGESLGAGTLIFHAKTDPSKSSILARITGGDRWPENDEMRLTTPSEIHGQRWWIHRTNSNDAPPDNSWRSISAGETPTDPVDYLSASIIVLDDIPADDLSPLAQRRLEQYVRDLGGTLVILGGEHSFGAGGYSGTTLNAISPLSSDAPSPQRHWILLLDSSGSMATSTKSSRTRWDAAVDALRGALPRLSPNDPISVGSFADAVRWWWFAKPARETLKLLSGLNEVSPRGPTNLQAALEQLATKLTGDLSVELLILSDADAKIDDPDSLAARLKSAHVRVHLLAIADLSPSNPIAHLVSATGGTIAQETDPSRWTAGLRNLIRSASPDPIDRSRLMMSFKFAPSSRDIESHNITWPTKMAESIASAKSDDRTLTLAASRALGLGMVIAIAFRAEGREISAIEREFAHPPIDPRFTIGWEIGPVLHLRIDAADPSGAYLNQLELRCLLFDDAGPSQAFDVPQTGPGRYELLTSAPRASELATLRLENRVIARAAIAGRYAREFEGIGNDRTAMRLLAMRTGGAVIEPSQTQPLNFPTIHQPISIAPALAFIGCAFIALGLIHWRRSVT